MRKTLTIWMVTVLTLLIVLAIPAICTGTAKPAPAEHPEYRDAVNDLRSARKHLEKANNDGYGHRDRAMQAIDMAMRECDEAVRAMH